MRAQDLVLNIAVNLDRLSRWSVEKNNMRLEQFLRQTEGYFNDLKRISVDSRFNTTLERFEQEFEALRQAKNKNSYEWSEKALTWANILTHRAKLA